MYAETIFCLFQSASVPEHRYELTDLGDWEAFQQSDSLYFRVWVSVSGTHQCAMTWKEPWST